MGTARSFFCLQDFLEEQLNIPATLAVLAASTVPLIGLAILTSVLPLLSPQKGEQMSVALQGFLLVVSGVYYPLSVLPAPMQLGRRAQPADLRPGGRRIHRIGLVSWRVIE